jgi:2-keto-4-pentenoate hydratase/2-oxohepta-3-ene-1,7-dioic acid hydratase in catechol pathway
MRIAVGSVPGGHAQLWLIEEARAISIPEVARLAGNERMAACADIAEFLALNGIETLRTWQSAGLLADAPFFPLAALHLHAPISARSKIMCSAFNYHAHGVETKIKLPSEPYLFLKPTSSLNGPEDVIVKPGVSSRMDYECELAVMIGRPAKNIEARDALSYVAGYFVANDVSFRDFQYNVGHEDLLQSLGQNWLLGKGLDTALPAGPWLTTVDESGHGPFRLECQVNGETVQQASTDEMIFDVATLIAHASRGMTLQPGDVISTGTPAGVAQGGSRRYLEAGDRVTCEIAGLGALHNRVVDEA